MTIADSASGDSLAGDLNHGAVSEIQAFGFWIYLMSDLVLFAALFATYATLRHSYAGGPSGQDLFNLPYVFVESMLLLISSATCGFAMLNVQSGKITRVLLWLSLTFVLGLGFIVLEIMEFRHLVLDGHGPAQSGFLSAFFTLVGTHGVHVSAGLIWILFMIFQLFTKRLSIPVQSRLMRLSIFWHFLDIVWVALFTLVYLFGVLA